MKTTIGVMGASSAGDSRIERMAEDVGRLVAQRGVVLITGATTGYPLAAARGASLAGGQVIGFSPAINASEHKRLGLPLDHHDLILYTGLSFKGRNLLNVRASSALLFVGGSMGALNEFTIAYDEAKIIGILEGSGGFCDRLREWLPSLHKPGNRSIIHYASDPAVLLDLVLHSIRQP
jgi:uncharacterized protein (TIGR00725 family)